jgi:hypothetical protein
VQAIDEHHTAEIRTIVMIPEPGAPRPTSCGEADAEQWVAGLPGGRDVGQELAHRGILVREPGLLVVFRGEPVAIDEMNGDVAERRQRRLVQPARVLFVGVDDEDGQKLGQVDIIFFGRRYDAAR